MEIYYTWVGQRSCISIRLESFLDVVHVNCVTCAKTFLLLAKLYNLDDDDNANYIHTRICFC